MRPAIKDIPALFKHLDERPSLYETYLNNIAALDELIN
jgi:hypothetical protein